MITVTSCRKHLEFNNIEDYYKWLIKNKLVEDIKISGSKEANDLYEFFRFYYKVKKEFESGIDDINNSFLDDKDNSFVTDAIKELIRMNSDGKYLRAALIALGYISGGKKDSKYLPLSLAY